MQVIVTDQGFTSEAAESDWTLLAADQDLPLQLDDLMAAGHIAIDFPSSHDGRGFTLARRLRLAGFGGRLRASGNVIPDQYAMARRSGFDEVAISADRAKRQPEADWLARADWQANDYQARLRG